MQERRETGWIFTIVAVLLALVASVLAFRRQSELETIVGNIETVVIASEKIEAGTIIDASLLSTQEIPQRYVHNTYVRGLTDPLDFVATTDIEEGQILQWNFLDQNSGLEPGYRAISIATNNVGSIGGNVRPLNRVDIIVSYSDELSENQRTVYFLENVLVLAVNSLLDETDLPTGVRGNRFLPDGNLIEDAIITLALLPEDAAKLAYMDTFGRDIRLVARRLDEPQGPSVPPVSIETFEEFASP